MSAALLAIVLLLLVGVPAVLSLDPRLPGGARLGLGFLFGGGIVSLLLAGLSAAGFPWSLWNFAFLAAPIVALLLAVVAKRRGRPAVGWDVPPAGGSRLRASLPDLLTGLCVVGHGIYASLAPLGQWDFWTVWGLKAKAFWLHRGIDWRFLESAENLFAHPDYPLLLPLLFDFFAMVAGAWEDRWIGLLFTAYAVALLLVTRELLREELGSRTLASVGTLALAGPALVIWIGLAEGPLIAYGSLGLLMIRRGLRRRHPASWAMGACLLGFGALTKNEGVTLLIAAAAGLLLDSPESRRNIFRLWPAALLSASWLVPRHWHGLSTDVFVGSAWTRVLGHVRNPAPLWNALTQNLPDRPVLWIFVLLALVFLGRRTARKEIFVLATALLQIVFYLVVYISSPHDLVWHFRTSWARLLTQQLFPLAFLAVAGLLRAVSIGPRPPESALAAAGCGERTERT